MLLKSSIKVILIFGIYFFTFNFADAQEKVQSQTEITSTKLFAEYSSDPDRGINQLSIGYSSYRPFNDGFMSIFYDINIVSPLRRTFYNFTISIIPGLSINIAKPSSFWLSADFGAGIASINLIDFKYYDGIAIAGLLRIGSGYSNFGICYTQKILLGYYYSIQLKSLGLSYNL